MGFLDKAKDKLDIGESREEDVKASIDKVADFIDEKTGGKASGQIDDAAGRMKDVVDKLTD